MSGTVFAICVSDGVGTAKREIADCRFLENLGLEGDGHAGTIRQVSLLMQEDVIAFNKDHEFQAKPGEFAENILTEGIDLSGVKVGQKFQIGEAVLEATQIGKEVKAHHYSFHGFRLLPTRGVFCRVITGGKVAPGTQIIFL